MSHKYTN